MKYLILALLTFCAHAETMHPVNDYSGVLSPVQKETIASAIVSVRESTGAQLGVVIVQSTNGVAIEEASMKVAESWKLGSSGKDDGLLLFIAIGDRKSRIEVGRGLEGFLTDAKTKEILVNMRPFMKQGDYAGGVLNAVNQLGNAITVNKSEIMVKPQGEEPSHVPLYIFFSILGLFVLYILYVIYENLTKVAPIMAYAPRVPTKPGPIQSQMRNYPMSNYSNPPHYSKSTSNSKNKSSAGNSRNKSTVDYLPNYSSSYDSNSSSSYDSGSSSSGSDWGGGGGSFSGGGSSDSW